MFTNQPSAEELRLDEEIRQLEMKKNRISMQNRTNTPPSPTAASMQYTQPPSADFSQLGYPYTSSFQPPISFNPYQYQQPGPFMMMPPPQQQQQDGNTNGNWAAFPPMYQPPAYPQGYFIPPYMGPPPPYAFPPQQQTFVAPPQPVFPADQAVAAAAADLEKLKQFAAEKTEHGERGNLGVLVGNAITTGAQVIGSSALVMVRDLFDTTKERAEPSKLSVQHLQELEQEAVNDAMQHIEATQQQQPMNEKQKIKKLKSVRQLLKAKSVNEVVMGLKNSGREQEAESLARRVLALRRQMYGDTHEATAHALNQLASVLARKGNLLEAEETFASALTVLRAAFQITDGKPAARSSRQVAMREVKLMHNLAAIKLKRSGADKAEALQLGLQIVELCRQTLGDDHAETVRYKHMWLPGFHAANPVVAV